MVSGPTWWILQEVEAAVAEAPLATYTTAAIIVAALVVLAVAVAFGAFWWRLASAHNRTLAEQYRRLANRIQGQKQLLDSINGAIEEFIGLKAPDGTRTGERRGGKEGVRPCRFGWRTETSK